LTRISGKINQEELKAKNTWAAMKKVLAMIVEDQLQLPYKLYCVVIYIKTKTALATCRSQS